MKSRQQQKTFGIHKVTYLRSISWLGYSPRQDHDYNDRCATGSAGTHGFEYMQFYNLLQQQSLQML